MRRPAEATAALLEAATELGPVDVRLARDILVEAVVQAQINGQLAPDGATPADVARVAESLSLPPGTPATVGDWLLNADMTLQLHGLGAAATQLRQAISAARHAAGTAPEFFRWLAAACSDATILADDIALHELAWRMEAQAREQGAAIALSLALSHAGVSELLAGRLPEAERCFHERVAVEEARGRDWTIGPLLLAAWRGQPEQAQALLDTVTGEAARQGQGYQLALAGYARCILELGRGRYDQAHASLSEGIHDGSQIKFVLPGLVEAAERSGHHDTATRLTGQLAGLAEASPVPRTLGFLARARTLTAREARDAEPLSRPRSSTTTRPGARRTGPAATSSTANGCAAPDARGTPARNFAPPTASSARWARRASRPGPGWSCRRRVSPWARRPPPRPTTGSPRRKPGWPAWPRRARRTRRSPPSCTSAPTPWTTTCGRCSGNWA